MKGFGRAIPNPVTTSLLPSGFKTATVGWQQCHNWDEISERLPGVTKSQDQGEQRVVTGKAGTGQIREALREQVRALECHQSGREQPAKCTGSSR